MSRVRVLLARGGTESSSSREEGFSREMELHGVHSESYIIVEI